MSSKSAAQRSSPTKRSDSRQRPKPIQRQTMRGGSLNPAEMQKRLGNQGTQAWLAEQRIQPKRTIGQPGDKYEQEADRTADAVMRMPDPGLPGDEETKRQAKPQVSVLQRSSLSTTTKNHPIQRLCTECEKELVGQSEQKLQRKEKDEQTPHVTQGVEANINALDGKGNPLPDSTRNFFEPRFGADFSQVRVHTDTQASETAKSINAKAFTTGNNIVFGQGQFAPNSHEGQKLIGHELTHVQQQGGFAAFAREGTSEFLNRSIMAAATPSIQPDWLDDAEAAVSDTYDSVSSAVGDAYDSVTSAVSEVTEEVTDEVKAAVSTISDVGQNVYDQVKETGEKYSSVLLEQKKASLLAQINGALQKVSGQESVALTDNQIASLNGNLAVLREKSQGLINLPGIVAQTNSSYSISTSGTKLVDASTVTALLLNLKSSVTAPLMSPDQTDGISDSETIQGSIQRVAVAAVPLAIGGAILTALSIIAIIGIIAMLIWIGILAFRDTKKFPDPDTKTDPKDKTDSKDKTDPEKKPDDDGTGRRPPPLNPKKEKKERGGMRSQIQRSRRGLDEHLGSADVVASDPDKGVTAREFEQIAMIGALNNYRERREKKQRPFGTERNEKNITFSFATQSRLIRKSIVPGGGVIKKGDINALRQKFPDAETGDEVRVDVENTFGHNLKENI